MSATVQSPAKYFHITTINGSSSSNISVCARPLAAHHISLYANITFPLATIPSFTTLTAWATMRDMPSASEPETVYLLFGRRLRELRRNKDLPQHELATLSGLSRSSIANIEAGKQRVLLHQLLQFAEALHLEVGALVPTPAELARQLHIESRAEKDSFLRKLHSLTGSPQARWRGKS